MASISSSLILSPIPSLNSRPLKSLFFPDFTPCSSSSSTTSTTSSSSLISSNFLSHSKNLLSNSNTKLRRSSNKHFSVSASSSPLQALIFDCDGVILESEHLHRQAYNDAFAHFNVRCSPSASEPLNWGIEFYDELQNQVGGGKPKMRWYFKKNGWPTSSIFESPPEDDTDKAKLIDTLQGQQKIAFSAMKLVKTGLRDKIEDEILANSIIIYIEKEIVETDWKTERYKEIIKSGTVEPRPGVLRLMDEVKTAGIKLAVCSAATKSSVILCLENLIGIERFEGLDCFLAGDDVKQKKPDPSIYLTAAKKLGVLESNCLVVEDSIIGLQAATGAGMSCVVTFTSSTANQDFKDAIAIYPDLSNVKLEDLELLLENAAVAK